MGIFNSFGAMSGQFAAKQERTQVAGALVQELKETPGGVEGILHSFRQNGLESLIRQWALGETASADPGQVEQGLRGTELAANLAQRTRMPAGIVKAALAVLLPLLIAQLVEDGVLTAEGQPAVQPVPQPENLLPALLGRLK